ncbi:nucleotide 5'-monophosphate nucleosidase PpnN [unidentified bacterial endosymbiont]|uniref:nucleotide 5'-monophosphate nucleosidase PpnN n=1 Tax=unidentified bacterial endosymbiont TaxID=2355 RepID=UPI00209D2D5C|nr:nucleotide 5'-monophosphate nucleosidase PpnN [unidentified bacterial endosymbiont]
MLLTLNPVGPLAHLSPWEMHQLQQRFQGEPAQLLRHCALAVLNSGSQLDSSSRLLAQQPDFDIQLLPSESGIQLQLRHPPQQALVDGQLIRALHENLFAVLRDLLFLPSPAVATTHAKSDLTAQQITQLVFSRLRHAEILTAKEPADLVICWGGHAIHPTEYQYAQQVGYELGLRALHIVTGCGPGAMEAPMKGAARGHAKQRLQCSRLIGLTEPSIIAAEPPNTFVNQLVILPDIEKRLEAFVRIAQGIVIFPGGPGTAEELLYLLGILMHPDNQQQQLPVVLTGPRECAAYWQHIEQFIHETLGPQAGGYYRLVIDDAAELARHLKQTITRRLACSLDNGREASAFNASLVIPPALQQPFQATHEAMAQLTLQQDHPPSQRAITLRQLFSGIVAGNIRAESIQAVAERGPFCLKGDPYLMQAIDRLLHSFVAEQRMQLPGAAYIPCYEIAS